MVQLDGLQGMIAGYCASPKGQETIKKYLSSPEGQKTIDAYLATPGGQAMARLILLRALEGLDLPAAVKAEIRRALSEKGS